MNAFIGLVKKDLSLMRFWYLMWLAFTVIGMGGGYALTEKFDQPNGVVPIFVMLAGIHIFLMPILLLHVLRIEGKNQMWLYNPQSSRMLLFSKICAALLLQIGAQVLLSLYGLFVMNILVNNDLITRFSEFLPVKQGIYFEMAILSTSIYVSMWVVFLWTFYHSLGKFPKLNHFRGLLVLLVWIAYNLLETFLTKIHVIEHNLFAFGINLQVAPKATYDPSKSWRVEYIEAALPIIPILYYTILTVSLFFAASWLLEKKVEV